MEVIGIIKCLVIIINVGFIDLLICHDQTKKKKIKTNTSI